MSKIAHLLQILGAEIHEDSISVEVFVRNIKKEKTGFVFMKNMFFNRVFYMGLNVLDGPIYSVSVINNGWTGSLDEENIYITCFI